MTIIKKPIITEKAAGRQEQGTYTFVVDRKANKLQIKEEVERLYSVSVESVRTLNYQGKQKTRYTKTTVISGRRSSHKRAIVKVADGEFIDFYAEV